MTEAVDGRLVLEEAVDTAFSDSTDIHELKRTLGPLELSSLGIGAIIGAGIFVLTGHAAAAYAGPAIVLSFVLSGIACSLSGLCYAEMAAMIPVSGSAYTYSKHAFGRFVSWIIGWDLILEYLFGAATVAVGWSSYLVSFLRDTGLHFPQALCSAPLDFSSERGFYLTGSVINAPACFVVILITILLVVGIHESSRVNNAIVITKLLVILLFICAGAAFVKPENWNPFIPPSSGHFGEFGWSGILRGAGVIFFSYIGFDAVSTAAQEAKHPQRDMPIGIMASLGVCTFLYVAVALVMTGIVK